MRKLVVALGLVCAVSRDVSTVRADDLPSKPGKATDKAKAEPPRPEPVPQEFLAEAQTLLVVGACAEGKQTQVKQELVDAHCKKVRAAQDAYRKSWLAPARTFFQAHVPADAPKTVVYPFAGGDLSTALTVYPDADEITTLSLEPAGDPRALGRLADKQKAAALATVATELESLYTSNFSKTMNMINAMRGGQLPTQLIFSLSALHMHGYELVGMKYFQLTPKGELHYLTDADAARAERVSDAGWRNRQFANVELRFKKPGSKHEQIYRHIMANLDDPHLAKYKAPLLHLEAKGHVAAMTKAASYLLTFPEFSTMRRYVIDHVDWMVSDTTGLAPAEGTPAGFEYETYGTWESSNMHAGKYVTPQWKALFKSQPARPLAFRFGYPDGKLRPHLVVMRRAKAKKA
ncbi:MAG TPA: hypothetical protein VFQ53_08770 [Kofleriaceae bacterium]|nr:hypothetical protein [Kofleriaceae bacterium]